MKTIIAAMLISSTLLAGMSVEAGAATKGYIVRTRVVPHGDLDLATSGGQRTLKRRLALALESVCGSYANVSAEEEQDVTRCRREAKARIAPQLANIVHTDAPIQEAMIDR